MRCDEMGLPLAAIERERRPTLFGHKIQVGQVWGKRELIFALYYIFAFYVRVCVCVIAQNKKIKIKNKN